MEPEDHGDRFDERASTYDEDRSPTYRECADLVVAHARAVLEPDDVVLDLGVGTGAIGLALAADAGQVLGRDVSSGMLAEARRKARERGLENVSLGEGRFREPAVDGPVDLVVSNFAMHHLSDAEKREAVAVLDDLDPDRVVLGDVMFFGEPDPEEPCYDPSVDDPATVGTLVEAFTDVGFVVTAAERVHDQVGVLVADWPGTVDGSGAPDGAGRAG